MAFDPYMADNGDYSVAHTPGSASVYIKQAAQVGLKFNLSGRIVLNCTGPAQRPGPYANGPEITVPIVVIPAECQGVVFGQSGRVYIDYGDSTYQELKNDGTLGSVIAEKDIV